MNQDPERPEQTECQREPGASKAARDLGSVWDPQSIWIWTRKEVERRKKKTAIGILLSPAFHLQDSGSNKLPLRERHGRLGATQSPASSCPRAHEDTNKPNVFLTQPYFTITSWSTKYMSYWNLFSVKSIRKMKICSALHRNSSYLFILTTNLPPVFLVLAKLCINMSRTRRRKPQIYSSTFHLRVFIKHF